VAYSENRIPVTGGLAAIFKILYSQEEANSNPAGNRSAPSDEQKAGLGVHRLTDLKLEIAG
jgi:hypothetical protein